MRFRREKYEKKQKRSKKNEIEKFRDGTNEKLVDIYKMKNIFLPEGTNWEKRDFYAKENRAYEKKRSI